MAGSRHITVAFLNENTLGHGSYLPRFAAALAERPELRIQPLLLDVIPLPPHLQRRADFSIRGLRRFGLDFHAARWRRIASEHALSLLEEARQRQRISAVVVNTQSVALRLTELATSIPMLVCLDATFAQLQQSRWFAMNPIAGALTPFTLAPILPLERDIFSAARMLLPWSSPVRESLLAEYDIPIERIELLPPSLDLRKLRPARREPNDRKQILFLGGDFKRKGGPLLLDAFRGELAERADLHVITHSDVPAEPGLYVHHGVKAGSPEWQERWSAADVFVFPSALETFGIVLLEALAFEVPIVASRAGAAVDLLDQGGNGILLETVTPASLRDAINQVLSAPKPARERALRGRALVERAYDLDRNTSRLAELIWSLTPAAG